MSKKRFCILPISLCGIFSPFFIDYDHFKNKSQILIIIYFVSWLILFSIFPNISKFLVTKPLYITDVEFNDNDLDEILYFKTLEDIGGLESLNYSDKASTKTNGSVNLYSKYRMEIVENIKTSNDETTISISNISEMSKFNYLIKIYTVIVNILLALFLSFISTYILSHDFYKNRSWFELIGLIGGNISTFITLQSIVCKITLTCCGKLKEKYKEKQKLKINNDLENSLKIPIPSNLAIKVQNSAK